VPGGEGRVEPLGDERSARLEAGDELAGAGYPRPHTGHDGGATLRDPEPAREPEDAFLDLSDCPRVERDDLGVDLAEPAHLGARDRADLAQVLREDQVGPERVDQLLVDRVERAPVGDRLPDRAVDLEAPELARIDPRGGDDGQAAHLGRPIALGGDADEAIGQAKSGHDLGRAREQRADAHASATVSVVAARPPVIEPDPRPLPPGSHQASGQDSRTGTVPPLCGLPATAASRARDPRGVRLHRPQPDLLLSESAPGKSSTRSATPEYASATA
jgi:hypothetical protein